MIFNLFDKYMTTVTEINFYLKFLDNSFFFLKNIELESPQATGSDQNRKDMEG
jgi:hypothetical protein